MGENFPEGKMSETKREYAANYRKPPEHTRFKKGQSGNPRGRPAKNLPALLAAALNEKVTITENGKRRQVTKREAVITQLVNKSASAELRATKMLIDMLRDIEKKAEPEATAKSPFGPTDKEVVQQLITRLRRNMCSGCPWAARRGDLDGSADGRNAETTGQTPSAE
jgi:Family of unknown function (DUF5681)